MARQTSTGWGIWLIAGGSGVLFVGMVVVLFRAPTTPAPKVQAKTTPPAILLNAVADHASADSALLDPTPLFLPTEWNSGIRKIAPPAFNRQLGEEFPAEDRLSEAQLASIRKDPLQTDVPWHVVLTGDPPKQPFLGFGQKSRPDLVEPISARGGRVDVFDATTGERVYGHSLEVNVHPPGPDLWQPAEFTAAVDAAGLVGPVVETGSSGVEEVDSFFRTYLDRSLKLGLRLSPGLYRITVGP